MDDITEIRFKFIYITLLGQLYTGVAVSNNRGWQQTQVAFITFITPQMYCNLQTNSGLYAAMSLERCGSRMVFEQNLRQQ